METLLTVNDLAKTLKVHPKSVYRWVYTEQLECTKVGGTVRFTEDQVKQFLDVRVKKLKRGR